MGDHEIIEAALSSVAAAPTTIEFLRRLHTEALAEASYVSTDAQPATNALERFVALEPDKCAFVYLLLRSSKARHVVEAGTSFGLSTIYLALAVGQNATELGLDGKVIATENEPTKADRARQHWRSAGNDVEKWIELREGDLLETLSKDLPNEVDFVLFDIWAALALPTLHRVYPRLKTGATLVVDNINAAKKGYKEFLEFLDNPANGFKSITVPYAGGLKVAVYLGPKGESPN